MILFYALCQLLCISLYLLFLDLTCIEHIIFIIFTLLFEKL